MDNFSGTPCWSVDGQMRSCLFRVPTRLADGFGLEDGPYACIEIVTRFTPTVGSPAFLPGSSASRIYYHTYGIWSKRQFPGDRHFWEVPVT